ncbi:MAG: Ig-like domain-containing protein, partial [Gemmatimonadaceae bacterium]
SYDASKLPEGVTPDALKLSTWVDDHWEVVPGSTLNIADATVSADIAHFSYYGIAIWPNASYNNATQQVELTKGQRTTLNGYTYYVYTYPQTQCWQVRRWVRYWGGGYWTYYQQCTTYTQAYSYPTQGVRVSWLSSAPSVASLGSPAYSVTDAGGRTQSPPITALTAGSTDVTGSASGVTSSSTRVTVLPSLLFSVFGTGTNPFRKFGFRQGTGLVSIIPAPLAAPLTVTLTHTNSFVASSNPTAIIGAGRTSEGVTLIAGEVAGRDTIIGTAPGYTPDTLVVETALGRISVDGWPSSLAYGDSAAIRIHPTNEDGFIDNAWLTFFALGSNGKLSFSRNSVAITSITVPDGSSSTPVFYVKAVGAGSGIMSVANNWYITSPYEVPIVGGFVSIQVAPDPAGVIPGGTVQLTGTARNAAGDPVSGVVLSWSSASTAVAGVDANGLVTGVANGTVIVTASSGGISGSATVEVGTPSMSASPGSLTLPVQQGQSAQAQITITNGGGGVLSGLQAGSFSNYFNGSPAPWVTASWNTTTAPATLTITAAPGLGIPTGVHQLRFDVSAPGASNSPYTFYSINITVIAAGVTPVNATISPTPGSVSFNVALGQSAQAQIAINNSGTDPLTNLTAGPFSNYFNGSPAPWVTASFNTTTAPATLTITAAPDVSVGLGTHQLRFEVSSPGATNSPYTFYSINVTVTEPPFRLGSIDAAGGFTCATTLPNAAYCWGSNGGVGTLGIGVTNNNNYPTPIAVAGGLSFASVSTDASHTCALTPAGAAYCWGYGSDTRLGTGIDQGSNVPVAVAGGHTFVQIDVGDNHACAVDNLQRAYCWGYGMLGNLANTASASSRGNSSVPTLVLGGVQFLRVVAGGNFSCGVATDQTAYCWGLNSVGQLGAPSPTTYNCDPYTCSLLPTAVSGGLQFQSITAGSQHACGVTTGGEVYCWGGNGSGQLGDGSTINSLVPVRVSSMNGATQVDAGNAHSCARTGFGQLYCWGANASGQLGRGNQISSPSAGLVSGNGMSFSRVTAGGAHSCAITSVGSAYCWGGNGNGQLGIGSVTAPQTVPTLVAVP